MTTESTVAKIGRSMKNFEIMDSPTPWHERAGIPLASALPRRGEGDRSIAPHQYPRSAAVLTSPYSRHSRRDIARCIAGFPGGVKMRGLDGR
jgi:hypothetical protein